MRASHTTRLLALAALAAATLVAQPASAATLTLTPTTTSTTGVPVVELLGTGGQPSDINESNWVAGTLAGRAVVWRTADRWFENLPQPRSGVAMEGLGLNDDGMIVGRYGDLGFRWEDSTGIAFLPTPPVLHSTFNPYEARDVDQFGNILVSYVRDNSSCGTGANLPSATAVLRAPYNTTFDYDQARTAACQNEVSGRAIDAQVVAGNISTRSTNPSSTRPTCGTAATGRRPRRSSTTRTCEATG